jgi:group I intron endonuclease
LKLTTESGIYRIMNTVTRMVYIGKTSDNIRTRISNHKGLLKKGKHPNKLLQRDWNEYGEKTFTVKVLRKISNGKIEVVEKEIITQYLLDGVVLYNVQDTAPLLNG